MLLRLVQVCSNFVWFNFAETSEWALLYFRFKGVLSQNKNNIIYRLYYSLSGKFCLLEGIGSAAGILSLAPV